MNEKIKKLLKGVDFKGSETEISKGEKVLVSAMMYDMVAMALKVLAAYKSDSEKYNIKNGMDDETAEKIIDTIASLQSMICQTLEVNIGEMKLAVRLANLNRDDIPDEELNEMLEESSLKASMSNEMPN